MQTETTATVVHTTGTRVWVCDEVDSWIKAEVLKIDGEMLVIRTEKGKEKKCRPDECPLQNPETRGVEVRHALDYSPVLAKHRVKAPVLICGATCTCHHLLLTGCWSTPGLHRHLQLPGLLKLHVEPRFLPPTEPIAMAAHSTSYCTAYWHLMTALVCIMRCTPSQLSLTHAPTCYLLRPLPAVPLSLSNPLNHSHLFSFLHQLGGPRRSRPACNEQKPFLPLLHSSLSLPA